MTEGDWPAFTPLDLDRPSVPQAPSNPVRVAQEHLRVFLDLAISADTAEIMMRPYYPGEAASLHAKVKAAKEILDVSVCKTCWGHGWIDDDKGGHTCADCAAPVPRLSEERVEAIKALEAWHKFQSSQNTTTLYNAANKLFGSDFDPTEYDDVE